MFFLKTANKPAIKSDTSAPVAPARSRVEHRPDGRLVGVVGSSRQGKTAWTAREVDASRRLLVWDYKGEWFVKYRCRRVTTFDELSRCVLPGAKPERIAFCMRRRMDKAAFETFCRLAWVWINSGEGDLVVEETSSVTSPGKAPGAWGDILRMGLGYGANIYALAQRPAESDKTAFGNATVLHCHWLQRRADRQFIAEEMDIDIARVSALKKLEYIERDAGGEIRTGIVSFSKSRKSRARQASQ